MSLQTRAQSAHLPVILASMEDSNKKCESIIGIWEEEAKAFVLVGNDIALVSILYGQSHIV